MGTLRALACFALTLTPCAWPAEPSVCAACHPRETANYARTAMANSVGVPRDQPGGRVDDRQAHGSVSIENKHGRMVHRLVEDGLTAEYAVPYYVGAGKVGRSYIVRAGDYLFQSPVSFYTARRGWDLTPGYTHSSQLDFNQPITSGCLFCHTGAIEPLKGAANRYADPPFTAISCQRCHGSSDEHLRRPSAANIVNPAKLARFERDSVCEQCHLEGEARILNPARDWWDFKPGQLWERTAAVYLRTTTDDEFRAVSEPEQLSQSRCARASGGKLWCGTCHDPHGPPADRTAQVKRICQSCHPSLSAAHPAAVNECVTCHMPAREATDVDHAAITDHRIRKPAQLQVQPVKPDALVLRAWREPAPSLHDRDLGLAYVQVAETERSPLFARKGAGLLTPADDPAVLTALGSLLLQQRLSKEAAALFGKAASLEPSNAEFQMYLGIARREAGDARGSITALDRSISLDPSEARACLELARTYAASGNTSLERSALERCLKVIPQSIVLREALP
jgi:predicted CXXCH cytochrome family protein